MNETVEVRIKPLSLKSVAGFYKYLSESDRDWRFKQKTILKYLESLANIEGEYIWCQGRDDSQYYLRKKTRFSREPIVSTTGEIIIPGPDNFSCLYEQFVRTGLKNGYIALDAEHTSPFDDDSRKPAIYIQGIRLPRRFKTSGRFEIQRESGKTVLKIRGGLYFQNKEIYGLEKAVLHTGTGTG